MTILIILLFGLIGQFYAFPHYYKTDQQWYAYVLFFNDCFLFVLTFWRVGFRRVLSHMEGHNRMKSRKTVAGLPVWVGAVGSLGVLIWWCRSTSSYLDQLCLQVSSFEYLGCAYRFGCPNHAHLNAYYKPLPAFFSLVALVLGLILRGTSSSDYRQGFPDTVIQPTQEEREQS